MKKLSINWKYTFGEIIIVIIGITIAFTLNNFKENSVNRKEKAEYLENIKIDIENEKQQLEENIAKFENYIGKANILIPYLAGKKAGRDSIYNVVFELAHLINFTPLDVTYNTMINSGDFNLIKSFEIKSAIQKHYKGHNEITQAYNRQKAIHENFLAPYFIYEIDYIKIGKGDYSFMDDKEIQNIVFSLMGTYRIAIEASQKGIRSCENLIKILESEL